MMKKNHIILFSAFLFALILVEFAGAYMLPGDFMIGMLAEWRRKLSITSLELTSEWTYYSSDGKEEKTLSTHEYISTPFLWRIEMQGDNEKSVVIHKGKQTFAQQAGGAWKKEEEDILPSLFLCIGVPSNDELVETITKRDLDVQKRRLGRINNRTVGFVIGTEKRDERKTELWLEPKTFRPLRFREYIKIDGKETEIDTRFIDYSSPITGEWYPRVIEVYTNGVLKLRREALSIKVNPTIPASLFSESKK